MFKIDDTWTYRPPIWPSTLAYSFSAPMALITPVFPELEDACAPVAQPPMATVNTMVAVTVRLMLGLFHACVGDPLFTPERVDLD